MNLTKLFNGKYFLQNLKKSRALLILLMLLVPAFTSLVLVSMDENVYRFSELSIIPMIFMYIIPVALSMTLFQHVFKKASADFIGSMPISRLSIFLTNTLGGALVLILIQFVTALCELLLSAILPRVMIFPGMIWDLFIYHSIAYIFVFTIANLAVTISGNRFAQIAVTALITFLVPFFLFMGCAEYRYDYLAIPETGTPQLTFAEPYHFTAPSYPMDLILTEGEFELEMDGIVIAKMIVLSIVYIALGAYLFQRKKLELAGESFENKWIHLVVKFLTLTPFIAIFCQIDSDYQLSFLLVFLGIIITYYFVFDMITNKKIKLRTNIAGFVVSVVVLYALFGSVVPLLGETQEVSVKPEDIASVEMTSLYENWRTQFPFEIKIEDPDVLQMVIQDIYEYEYKYSIQGATGVTTTYQEPVNTNSTYVIEKDIPVSQEQNLSNRRYRVEYRIHLHNGKTYENSKYFNASTIQAILSVYGKEKQSQNIDHAFYQLESLTLSKEKQKQIEKWLQECIGKCTYQEWITMADQITEETVIPVIDIYQYRQHHLVSLQYPCTVSKELAQAVLTWYREDAKEKMEKNYHLGKLHIDSSDEIYKEILKQIKEREEFRSTEALGNAIPWEEVASDICYGSSYYATKEVNEWAWKDLQNTIDSEQPIMKIEGDFGNRSVCFYSNDIRGYVSILIDQYILSGELESYVIYQMRG